MTVISTETDAGALTLTVVAEFDAAPDRVWDVWENARKLERWWGPPTYPATFTRHDFVVGGESRYYMTSPAGERHCGWWGMREIQPPERIAFANGLAGDDGEPVPGIEPMGAEVTFEATATGTRMVTLTQFTDTAQMQEMIARQMPEGMTGAMSQIDALLVGATEAATA